MGNYFTRPCSSVFMTYTHIICMSVDTVSDSVCIIVWIKWPFHYCDYLHLYPACTTHSQFWINLKKYCVVGQDDWSCFNWNSTTMNRQYSSGYIYIYICITIRSNRKKTQVFKVLKVIGLHQQITFCSRQSVSHEFCFGLSYRKYSQTNNTQSHHPPSVDGLRRKTRMVRYKDEYYTL